MAAAKLRRKNYVCRRCGDKLPLCHARSFPATNTRVRYFRCKNPKCKARWKAIETLKPID